VSVGAPDFSGATVALLESRLAAETAAMVRRLGGDPISAPSLAEEDLDAQGDVEVFIDRLIAAPDTIVVLLTGAAVTRLFACADRLGRVEDLTRALAQSVTIARGPKPSGALARRGVSVSLVVPEPFTTASVLETLQEVAVEDRDAAVVHYGELNRPIVGHLAARGARVQELLLYRWRLPDDTAPLSGAIDAIIGGRIGVLAFTSQIQVRHLLDVAGGRRDALVAALNAGVIVGAVGPTCEAACAAAGLVRVITPAHPKLAPLLHALAAEHTRRRSPAVDSFRF